MNACTARDREATSIRWDGGTRLGHIIHIKHVHASTLLVYGHSRVKRTNGPLSAAEQGLPLMDIMHDQSTL